MRKVLFISVLSIVKILFLSTISFATPYTTFQLTDNGYPDRHPQINNRGDVAWFAWSDGDGVYLYDSATGNTIQIASNTGTNALVRLNNNGDVVWEAWDDSNTPPDYEIFLYDYSTGGTTQITDNSTHDQAPRINDRGDVVWVGDYDGSLFDLFIYNNSTGLTNQLSDNGAWWDYIDMNDRGDVVWVENGDIMLYDDSTGNTSNITGAYSGTHYAIGPPDINNTGDIVWTAYTDNVAEAMEIFLYDIASGNINRLTNNSEIDHSPQITSGGDIFWQNYDGTFLDVIRYDRAAGTTTAITDTFPATASMFRINDNGDVVWNSWYSTTDDTEDVEIYLYDSSIGEIIQLTDNSHWDGNPFINNSKYVTWFSSSAVFPDLSGDEIMLARPSESTPEGSNVIVMPEDPVTGNNTVTITYSNVTESGETTVTTSGTGTPPPEGFKIGNPPTYYEISTTANSSGQILVCIDYSGIGYGNENALKLMHREDTDGDGIDDAWIDRTCTPGVDGCPDPNPDTVNNIVCAIVDSFSEFAIFEPFSYTFAGFMRPLENQPVVNMVKSGRTVPVKWQLIDDYGGYYINDLSAVTGIWLQQTDCGASSENPILETDTSGSSGLRYDLANEQYIYNLQTDKTMYGCYTLILELYGLNEYHAYFEFK